MNKITLHHISGDFWSYLNLEEIYNSLGVYFLRYNVGPQFKYIKNETYFENGFKNRLVCCYSDFIIRDEKGKEITFKDFNYLNNKKYYNKKIIIKNTGPIPNTGKRRGYRLFRKPKTIQEKRLNFFNEAIEYKEKILKIKTRSKRNNKNLPDSWDDVYRSDCKNRSWKKFRKQQWRNI